KSLEYGASPGDRFPLWALCPAPDQALPRSAEPRGRSHSWERLHAEGVLAPRDRGVVAYARPRLPDGLPRKGGCTDRAFCRPSERGSFRRDRPPGRRSLPAPGPDLWEWCVDHRGRARIRNEWLFPYPARTTGARL